MNKQSIWIIGDVHGCFHTLQELISRLPNNAELIFVGDLCDKGNYSKDVIEFVIQNGYQCILGNHEAMMQRYITKVLYEDNYYGIDTGCVYGNKLTAIELGSMKIVQRQIIEEDIKRGLLER